MTYTVVYNFIRILYLYYQFNTKESHDGCTEGAHHRFVFLCVFYAQKNETMRVVQMGQRYSYIYIYINGKFDGVCCTRTFFVGFDEIKTNKAAICVFYWSIMCKRVSLFHNHPPEGHTYHIIYIYIYKILIDGVCSTFSFFFICWKQIKRKKTPFTDFIYLQCVSMYS